MNSRQRNALEIGSAPNSLQNQLDTISGSSRVSNHGHSRPLSPNEATLSNIRNQDTSQTPIRANENISQLNGDASFNLDPRNQFGLRTEGDNITERLQTENRSMIPANPGDNHNISIDAQNMSHDLNAQTNITFDTELNSLPENEVFSAFLKRFLYTITKWNIILFFSVLILMLFITLDVSLGFALIIFLLNDIVNLVLLIMKKNYFVRYPTRLLRILRFVEILFIVGFKAALLSYYLTSKSFYISAPLIPIILLALCIAIYQFVKTKRKSTKFLQVVMLGFKIFMIVQSLTIALKLDQVIAWRWREVLWAYWVTFSIMIGFTFASLLMSVNKCCALAFSEIEPSEILGVLWILFLVAGQTILSCVFVINLLGVIDQGKLLTVVIALLSYYFLFGIYTFLSRKNVIKFLQKSATSDEHVSRAAHSRNASRSPPKPKEEEKPFEIPKFLTKSSSTFFRRANDTEIKSAKEKNEYKKKKKQMAAQIKASNARLGRNSSADTSRFGRNTQVADTTTQMNLLTLQTTDRESQFHNLSRFDGADTTGRGLSGGYTTGRSGVASIVPQVTLNNNNHILPTDEERKEDLTMGEETLKDLDFPAMLNIKDLTSSKIVHEVGSEMNTPQTDMILPFKDKLKTATLSPELLAARLNNSNQSIASPQKDKMRKVHSVQVIPKPMYINLNNPVAILGDEPATLGEFKMEDSYKEGLSSDVSQTQEQKCLVCFDKEPDAVYMECGHGGVCYDCSLEVWKTTNECYLCREKIVQVLQVDFKNKLPGNVIKVISATQMIVYEEEEDENNPQPQEDVIEEIHQQ